MLDQSHVLSLFPEIKLSYANVVHNKVSNSDFYVAVPDGPKCFAWMTDYNDKPVCFVMELYNGKIQTVKTVNCCFDRELAYGTVLYGTVFNTSSSSFFSIEDVFYYRGNNISTYTWGQKLNVMNSLMNTGFNQKAYNKSFCVFGIPLMSRDLNSLVDNSKRLKYKLSQIQFKSYNRTGVHSYVWFDKIGVTIQNNVPIQNKTNVPIDARPENATKIIRVVAPINRPNKSNPLYKREIVFCIKPDIQNDVYNLYCLNADGVTIIPYGIACIPDFKTSVMMNSLFRNIKENQNLDLLEESDDDEEFENDRSDRFVFLDKKYNMVCAYNNKFRKWFPVRVSDQHTKIVSHVDLLMLEKK